MITTVIPTESNLAGLTICSVICTVSVTEYFILIEPDIAIILIIKGYLVEVEIGGVFTICVLCAWVEPATKISNILNVACFGSHRPCPSVVGTHMTNGASCSLIATK